MTLTLLHPDILTHHLPTLASLAEDPGIFADYLCDDNIKGWLALPMAERMAEMLLLYARDRVALPPQTDMLTVTSTRGDVHEWIPGMVHEHDDLLFPGHFTEAALGAWLRQVGDGRAEEIGEMRVVPIATFVDPQRTRWSGVRTRMLGRYLQSTIYNENGFTTEADARLDLKRRVLGMFGEVERKVEYKSRRCEIQRAQPSLGRAAFNSVQANKVTIDDGVRLTAGGQPINLHVRKEGEWHIITQTLYPVDFLPVSETTYTVLPSDAGVLFTGTPSPRPAAPVARAVVSPHARD